MLTLTFNNSTLNEFVLQDNPKHEVHNSLSPDRSDRSSGAKTEETNGKGILAVTHCEAGNV